MSDTHNVINFALQDWKPVHSAAVSIEPDGSLLFNEGTSDDWHLIRVTSPILAGLVRLKISAVPSEGCDTEVYVNHWGGIDVCRVASSGAILDHGIAQNILVHRRPDGGIDVTVEFQNTHGTVSIGTSHGAARYQGRGSNQYRFTAIEITTIAAPMVRENRNITYDARSSPEGLKFSDLAKYAEMQRRQYDSVGSRDPEGIVGSYAYHENVPYETQLLFRFGDVRKPIFPDFSQRKAFDIGCGEGRMIRRMQRFFAQVDGADISAEMVKHARERTPGSTIYLATGMDAGPAPSSYYDFAYCTISLQHICVHATRDAIIDDLIRILKSDGKMTLQLIFSKHFPYVQLSTPQQVADRGVQIYRRDTHHSTWLQNQTDAASTNSGCDVVIGADELEIVRKDFLKKFKTVEFWFYDISIGRGEPRTLSHLHPNSHLNDRYWGTHFIFVHCSELRQR